MNSEKGTGQRINQGKIKMSLVPPFAQMEYAKVISNSTKPIGKYDPRNWEKGMAWSVPFESMMRHMLAWQSGEDLDKESGLFHMAHVMCNAAFLVEYYRIYPEGDDRQHNYLSTMRLGLDIDGVIADWVTHWCQHHNIAIPTAWTFDRFIKDKFEVLKGDESFWDSIPLMCKPEDLPCEPVVYITQRIIPGEWTMKYLDKAGFPAAPVETVGWNQSKLEIAKEYGVEVFVDDKFETFVELNKNGILCYLMDAPYNQRYNVGHKRIYRVSDLGHLGAYHTADTGKKVANNPLPTCDTEKSTNDKRSDFEKVVSYISESIDTIKEKSDAEKKVETILGDNRQDSCQRTIGTKLESYLIKKYEENCIFPEKVLTSAANAANETISSLQESLRKIASKAIAESTHTYYTPANDIHAEFFLAAQSLSKMSLEDKKKAIMSKIDELVPENHSFASLSKSISRLQSERAKAGQRDNKKDLYKKVIYGKDYYIDKNLAMLILKLLIKKAYLLMDKKSSEAQAKLIKQLLENGLLIEDYGINGRLFKVRYSNREIMLDILNVNLDGVFEKLFHETVKDICSVKNIDKDYVYYKSTKRIKDIFERAFKSRENNVTDKRHQYIMKSISMEASENKLLGRIEYTFHHHIDGKKFSGSLQSHPFMQIDLPTIAKSIQENIKKQIGTQPELSMIMDRLKEIAPRQTGIFSIDLKVMLDSLYLARCIRDAEYYYDAKFMIGDYEYVINLKEMSNSQSFIEKSAKEILEVMVEKSKLAYSLIDKQNALLYIKSKITNELGKHLSNHDKTILLKKESEFLTLLSGNSMTNILDVIDEYYDFVSTNKDALKKIRESIRSGTCSISDLSVQSHEKNH